MSTKSIAVKIVLKGSGVVQTDSGDQKYVYNQVKGVQHQKHDNVTYGKKVFRKLPADSEGRVQLQQTLKISGDGLRHAIHADGMPSHTVNVLHHPLARTHYMASLDTLLRGYLLTDTGERRKSCYTITSAEETSGVQTIIEVHSRSGAKAVREEEGDKADTTLFYRESCGATEYEALAFIDINELRFISMSDLFDRRAVKDDLALQYARRLSDNLGSAVATPGYYYKKGSAYRIPEYGIMLTSDQALVLLDKLLRQMSSIFIGKSQSGYASTARVDIKSISDPLVDLVGKAQGWRPFFSSSEGLNPTALEGEVLDEAWEPVSEEDALAVIAVYETEMTRLKEAAREDKKAKDASKKDAKAKKAVAIPA